QELWKLDPTTGTLSVVDIVAGSGSSSPSNFTNVNGTLFFTASTSENGQELWKLDATGNPVLVKDIRVGNNDSSPGNLFNLNGTLYFTANDGVNGSELWTSDGTTAGTVLLEIYPGTNSSNPSNFIEVNNVLYFTADNASNGTELWRINATTGNPEVLDIQPGSNSSSLSNLTNVNGTLYFTASTLAAGTELWKIDPTTGTPTVIDIRTGSSSSSPGNLTNVNGTLYFTASSPTTGTELWKIDPTTGTPTVIDIVAGSSSSSPRNLINANGTLYFTASNSANGQELWKLDSTTDTPIFLKDIQEGSSSSNPGNLTYSNGKLYFTADDGTRGLELWETDGTLEGTNLTTDINQTSVSSNPGNFINIGGVLYFTANDDVNGTKLWKAHPTTGEVTLLETNPGESSNIDNFINVNGALYFTAYTPTTGTELWKIDPTTGTPTVIDIRTGSSSSSPSNLTAVNGTLYFTASSPTTGTELWKLDPTTGTPTVIDIRTGSSSSSPGNLINANGTLYFTASNSANGRELWKLDSTTDTPIFLKDIQEGSSSSNPGNLTYSNGKLYFTADDGMRGVELWAVDVVVSNTVGNIEKSSDEDEIINFSATDFADVFAGSSGLTLVSVKILLLPSNGVLKLGENLVTANQEILPSDLDNLTFVPNVNFNGTVGFTWVGSADGTTYAVDSSSVTLTINSVNDPPFLGNPISDRRIFSNRLSTFSIPANTFEDVDIGDSLTYSATLADGSPLPDWLTFSDRTFTANPVIGSTGEYEIRVTATDQSNDSASDTFGLTIVDSAPTNIYLSNNAIRENSANNTVVGVFTSEDNNTNDTHTYTLSDNAGGRFAIVGNQLVVADGALLDYENATQHTIRVKTTDNSGLSYERNITITVLVNNVAGLLSFTSSTFSVNEDGTPINTVRIQRTNGSTGVVSVTVELTDGSAIAPNDYDNTPITVTFGDGEILKTVTIPIVDDSIYEATETLNLTLSNPTGGARLGTTRSAILNIIDNDAVPGVLSFSAANFSLNEDGTPVIPVTINRTEGSNGNVSVTLRLTNGTASAGSDYIATAILLNFADGETSKIINVPIINDGVVEPEETINLTLVNPTGGATLGTNNQAILTIIDDDFKPTLTVNFANNQVTEGNTLEGTITRNTDTSQPLTVTLPDSNSEQITIPSSVIIPAGATSATFNLTAIDDTLIEPTRSYAVIATAQGFISGLANVSVLDNDRVTLSLSLDTDTINENSGKAIATVSRDVVSNTPLLVQLSSSDRSKAIVPNNVTIAANQASATFEVSAVDNDILDGIKTVTVTATPTYTGTNTPLPLGFATVNINIVDDESPSLSLTLDRDIISETGTATGTITRNTNTTESLAITVTSSDTTEATVPDTVTIPAGANSVTFTIAGVDDSINDGSQTVIITAIAPGLNSGTANLQITDIDIPDLVITQLGTVETTYTSQQAQFTYTVSNNGIISATNNWQDRVYLSTDNRIDASDLLLGEFPLGSQENPANLLPGSSYSRTVTYFTPRTPGEYYLIGITDRENNINEGIGIGENNNTTITPITINPGYRATVYTDTEIAPPGTPVVLGGQAISNSNDLPVPFEFVTIQIENNGNIRRLDAFTDANGNFIRQFNPLPREGGTYNINAYFPNYPQEDSSPEDQFTILGMGFERNNQPLTQLSHRITEGTTFNGIVNLQNLSNIDLTGITASVIGAPSNWTVSLTPEKTNLLGNEEIAIDYSIYVPDDQWQYYNFGLNLNTTEGVSASLPVRVDVARLLPRLVADTNSLQASMLRGEQNIVEFTVTNQGEIPSGSLEIRLPETTWLKSASSLSLPSLSPGESTQVSLLLQPSATEELTVYNGDVVIAGDEASLRLPFSFRAISEATGNLNISVVNELFFFAEGSPRLENATITLVDPFTGRVIFSETDADGLLLKNDLTEGYYKLRVTADSHDTYEGNIYIGAGETNNVQAFLSRQTVKYTWTVVPTEIEDRYTITIESVFETDVPIPTVVIEPTFIDLERLQVVGQVMQIDITATNHGLIAAEDINLFFGTHPFYTIEPLINNIDTLAAKSSITVPVRITRIADFDSLSTSGGELALQSTPSVPCSISAGLDYYYECAGEQIKRAIPIPFLNVQGNCVSAGSPGFSIGPGGGRFSSSGPGGGGRITPVTVNIQSSDCDPCKEKNRQALGCLSLATLGCVPNPLSTAATAIACTIALGDGELTFGDGGCIPGPIGCTFSIIDCLTSICYDFLSNDITTANASGTINAGLAQLTSYLEYWQTLQDFYLLYYGDSAWLEASSQNQELLNTWMTAFSNNTQGSTSAEVKISDTERAELLTLGLTNVLTGANVNKFIDRWNRTIDYYSQGIYTVEDVPPGENTDFLAQDQLREIGINIDSILSELQTAGYEDLTEATLDVVNELQTALEGDGGVCATVRLRIDQEAVMTRAAFLGTLEIENGNSTNIENLSVILEVKDAQGNIVNELFGITAPILQNISAVDGTGILTGNNPNTPQNEGIGTALWTFIPTNLAALEVPTEYNIGGVLSYLENGANITVPLLSAPITVFPQAELYLDYFHQRDVFADDPFTDQIEISVPYSLGVLVRNEGKGEAKNLKITSGQPKIIENEKGLLIDFQIIGSEVNGTGVNPSLTVDFGNIPAGDTAVANWLLKSSLQGKFIEYSATFEHINSLGKPELSLIKEVTIHELIRIVQVNHPQPDNLSDFLVNGTFDAEFTPDILYFSSGDTAPVKAVKNATIDAAPTINDLTVQISAAVEDGWTYFRLPEPSDSQFDIVQILRADGTQIDPENIWTTDRTFPATGRPTYENILHFLDDTTAGNTNYTVTYTPGGPRVTNISNIGSEAIATAVNAITVEFSEPIQGHTFDYTDLSLTLNGGSNLIDNTVTTIALSPTRYQITGLNNLTREDGEYTLTVNANGIQDTTGKVGIDSLSETWVKSPTGNADTTAPEIVDVVNLLINPRNQPVSGINVIFSEKIDLSTFTSSDITLTRDSGTNLINNSVTITAIDDTTYRINGLSGLTAIDGTYTLTVSAANIQDLAGNLGIGIQSENWVMDTIAPALPTNITVTNPLLPAGLSLASLQPLTVSGQQRINTTTPTISGELGETGLKVFFYDELTNQLLQQGTVTGTEFTGNVPLPAPGARELDIRLEDAAGNTTNTTLSLFADVIPPVITQFLNVPTSTPNSLPFIDVQFSELIDINTFDKADITLTRDGVLLTVPETVTVSYISDTTYRINGLENLTATPGTYSLQVDATTIQDNAGNSGGEAKTTTFTVTPPPTPGINLIPTGGSTMVTEGGNTDTYTISLKTQPTADVTITLSPGNQITTNTNTLIFTPANWNIAQLVTVTAVDDAVTEGTHNDSITHSITSGDSEYNSLTLPTVNVTITDNDAEITGRVWHDVNGNTARDENEPSLENWTVYLDGNNNSQLDGGEVFTTTDADGNYTFNDLRPGTYQVAQVLQEGWQQTYPIVNVSTTAADIPLFIPTLPVTTGDTVQLNFSSPDYIVTEDGIALTQIVVTRSGNLAGVVGATITFMDGTAQGCGCGPSSVNHDFHNIPITITFTENETTKVITVENAVLGNPKAIRIRNDSQVEGNEYLTIKLTNPTGGASIGSQGTATVTIIDDESPSDIVITPNTQLVSWDNSQPLSLINLHEFWADTRFTNIKGQGYSTVIIDTGIDLNHPLFGADNNNDGIADRIIYQYDFADRDDNASDKNNHGSHVASIATSIAPDTNLIILKVFRDSGSGYFSDLEAALQWVNSNADTYNIASVNLSLGDNQNWNTTTGRYGIGDELAAIANQNVIISAAAGNGFHNFNSNPGLAYPAIDPNVISVGAVWADDFGTHTLGNGAINYTTGADYIASFSQRHPLLDVFAPGILITGANATGGTITMGGTSQAAPYITGIATLAQEIAHTYLERELTFTEFRTLLDTTSDLIIDGDDENDNVNNTGIAYPRINMLGLAEGILNLNPTAPDTSNPGNSSNDNYNVATNTLSLVHTVTLTSGEIATDIDFGNQIIADEPPTVLNPISDITVDEDAENTIIDLSNVFTDVDNDVELIVKSVLVNDNTNLVTATIVENQLTLTYQPNEFGTANITIGGTSNGKLVNDTFTVTINSVNDTPTLVNPLDDITTPEDESFNFTFPESTFNDIDTGDNLTYTATTPSWLTFNPVTRTFSGTPGNEDVGTFDITLTATDTSGESVSDSFTLTVTE
ncbi:ELWxxDGT repeat protein, partial [Umezakia ovalisporum]|uniref:ELWxxDGT repeat protein n=1 Tax=Umezakia ovalisporum TaxID=75695 RepID=UPI0035B82711